MPEREIHPAAGAKRPLGIYLHIPFCKKKCLYCDFLSAPAADEVIGRYVDALCRQIAREAAAYEGFYVRTIFFGGGTPSLLSVFCVEKIMARLKAQFDLAQDAEITMECNPGTLDFSKLKGYKAAGINRLSIGLQSADDAELKALGRIHSYEEFLENYAAARRAGFANINVDLMSALPGQTVQGWLNTLCKVAELLPEHISAYSLIIEEGTPFYERYGEDVPECGEASCENTAPERDGFCAEDESGDENGAGEKTVGGKKAALPAFLPLPDEEEERLMYEQTQKVLRRYGYHRYEISNYAKPGRECLHNVGYWDRTDYLGLGLGAASMVDNVRWKITDDLEEYLLIFGADLPEENCEAARLRSATGSADNARKRIDGKCDGKTQRQILSKAEQMEEFMFLGLRLTAGISAAEFRRQFGVGIREIYGTVLGKLERDGLLVFYEDGKKMKLTQKGVDVSNYVLAQFLLDQE